MRSHTDDDTLEHRRVEERRLAEQRREEERRQTEKAEQDLRFLVEATDQLIAEIDVECDCVEAWASDVEPHMCAKHAAVEALVPFMKEKK